MNKRILSVIAILFFSAVITPIFIAPPVFSQSTDDDNSTGRFVLQDMKVGNEMVPFLVDTATGKVWIYQAEMGSKKKFVGLNVEGIAYSRDDKDAEALNKLIEQWHYNNFIDKTLKGIREYIFSELSYDPDIEKVEMIYTKLKNRK